MQKTVTLRMNTSMLERIKKYMENEDIDNQSEAIKNLLDLALNITEMKEKNPLNILDDLQKMQVEMWIIMAQLYLANANKDEQEKQKFLELSTMVRKSISSKYPDIFAQFESFILKS